MKPSLHRSPSTSGGLDRSSHRVTYQIDYADHQSERPAFSYYSADGSRRGAQKLTTRSGHDAVKGEMDLLPALLALPTPSVDDRIGTRLYDSILDCNATGCNRRGFLERGGKRYPALGAGGCPNVTAQVMMAHKQIRSDPKSIMAKRAQSLGCAAAMAKANFDDALIVSDQSSCESNKFAQADLGEPSYSISHQSTEHRYRARQYVWNHHPRN